MSEVTKRGLYEQILTKALAERLSRLDPRLHSVRAEIHRAEAADRIALHLSAVVERAVEALPEKERVQRGIELARDLIRTIDARIEKAGVGPDAPLESGEILQEILERQPDGRSRPLDAPLIPLLDTTLLTNAPGEPRVGRQILAEIDSADRIDVLMAFVRRSGVVPLRDALRRHCEDGRPLRVLTTTYTGSTERCALDLLGKLGAEIRVSYDTSSTRLHAKAWSFHRESGFSTAYIGSSNLTHSAQVSGLEWNVRVSGARNPDVIDKVAAVFDAYWEHDDFRAYDAEEFEARARTTDRGPTVFLSPVELRPEPFQSRLLDQLAVSRHRGHHRNLLVSATGTGKTVMAAIDYARLRDELPKARLLFVAHRKEILEQSLATFRHALRDANFGEPWVGGKRPRHFEHVFASIQSLSVADLDLLAPDHFDVVIVDEFHHAAAKSYERLLEHVEPVELLGLTATPERADGLPVLHWFGDRIAAELRVWDAIDQHYLTPFHYFGVHDGLDLRAVPWKRGRGYDVAGLTNVYTANDAWARAVVEQVRERAENLATMRALGFCVSVEHARFMARVFEESGLPSVAVWAGSPQDVRDDALRALSLGELKVVFSVDLFNEGVDLPDVDTLLLLRPTDSSTLFLQQLGRGLRKAKDKTMCTVLDFVGLHRREFRFDRRFRALLGGTRKDLEKQVRGGFPFLPAGCHMELDEKAADVVLRSIRDSIPSKWTQKADELRALVSSGRNATLATYLDHSGLELEDVYEGNRSWSDLCEAAGVHVARRGPAETALRRAIGRMLHVDDTERLKAYGELIARDDPPRADELDERQRRLARMLVASLVDMAIDKDADLRSGAALVWDHPQVISEMRELLPVLGERIDHLHGALESRPDVPLSIHARYTRREILAAFGIGDRAKVAPWQAGVYWAEEAKADLLAFTLVKTDDGFSPTTRYRDYAISRELVHWESQSWTREDSETGQRYQHHAARGTDVMLFARLVQSERAFWFLGPARYVRHTGERPMAIVWRLRHPLPGDLFAAFAAAVA